MSIIQFSTDDIDEFDRRVIEIAENNKVIDTEFDRFGSTMYFRAWVK